MMARVERHIRLDPAFDKRLKKISRDSGGKLTVTDVIHKALAAHFSTVDGGPSIDQLCHLLSEIQMLLRESAERSGKVNDALVMTGAAIERSFRPVAQRLDEVMAVVRAMEQSVAILARDVAELRRDQESPQKKKGWLG